MAIVIALLGFNDLGRSVTPTFLFRNWFCLQLSPHCPKMNKKSMWEGEKNSRFLSVRHRILPSCGCKVHTRAKFLPRSRRDLVEIEEISPRSRHDVCWILNLSEIAARYLPSRRDCRELAEIVEILPWCLWHSKSRRDRGEISSISPRLPRSRRDL